MRNRQGRSRKLLIGNFVIARHKVCQDFVIFRVDLISLFIVFVCSHPEMGDFFCLPRPLLYLT